MPVVNLSHEVAAPATDSPAVPSEPANSEYYPQSPDANQVFAIANCF